MNELKNESFNTALILSEKKATKPSNGALQVRGGIGVGKNIVCEKEILANELITKKNGRIGENLYVCGTIESATMFRVSNNELIFQKTLIPDKNIYSLGDDKSPWKNLYVRTINTTNIDIKIGSTIGTNNKNNMPIFNINKELENTTLINGNLILVDKELNSKVEYDQINNILNLNCILNNKINNIKINEDKLVNLNANTIILETLSMDKYVVTIILDSNCNMCDIVLGNDSNIILKYKGNKVKMTKKGQTQRVVNKGNELVFMQYN